MTKKLPSLSNFCFEICGSSVGKLGVGAPPSVSLRIKRLAACAAGSSSIVRPTDTELARHSRFLDGAVGPNGIRDHNSGNSMRKRKNSPVN